MISSVNDLNAFAVLIETLWNVKTSMTHFSIGRTICINRNIVECKDSYIIYRDGSTKVLIETLWNVKLNSSGEMLQVFLY